MSSQAGRYYIPEPSHWPIFGSIALLLMAFGATAYALDLTDRAATAAVLALGRELAVRRDDVSAGVGTDFNHARQRAPVRLLDLGGVLARQDDPAGAEGRGAAEDGAAHGRIVCRDQSRH